MLKAFSKEKRAFGCLPQHNGTLNQPRTVEAWKTSCCSACEVSLETQTTKLFIAVLNLPTSSKQQQTSMWVVLPPTDKTFVDSRREMFFKNYSGSVVVK